MWRAVTRNGPRRLRQGPRPRVLIGMDDAVAALVKTLIENGTGALSQLVLEQLGDFLYYVRPWFVHCVTPVNQG